MIAPSIAAAASRQEPLSRCKPRCKLGYRCSSKCKASCRCNASSGGGASPSSGASGCRATAIEKNTDKRKKTKKTSTEEQNQEWKMLTFFWFCGGLTACDGDAADMFAEKCGGGKDLCSGEDDDGFNILKRCSGEELAAYLRFVKTASDKETRRESEREGSYCGRTKLFYYRPSELWPGGGISASPDIPRGGVCLDGDWPDVAMQQWI